jgi:putative ABC transport system permease protein
MRRIVRWWTQVVAVSFFNMVSLRDRLETHLAPAVGVAGVVAVLMGVLSVAEGLRAANLAAAAPDTVLVLQGGSETELMSSITRDQADIVGAAPGVLRTADGAAISPEVVVLAELPLRSRQERTNVVLRGVEPAAFAVRPRFRLMQGRRFERGASEVIAGRGAAAEFAGAALGSSIEVSTTRYQTVGEFSMADSVAESEIWADAAVVQSAFGRSHYQSLRVRLDSRDSYNRFRDALLADPRLRVRVLWESEYYAAQSTALQSVIKVLGGLVSGLMGLGAVLGAVNAMYGSVAARTREIAILRAIGFRRGSIIVSVLSESLLVCVLSGLVGGLVAYLAFDGYRAATLNLSGFNEVAFAFQVTPALFIQGVVYAAVLGLLGGILPAWRAARLPVARAIRET